MTAPPGPAGRSISGPSPRDTVRVKALEIDRAPVTNARYGEFVAATGHRPPAFWPNGRCPRHLLQHPVVGVDLFDALAYAAWAGGRLPTEEEWMSAGGVAPGASYPWGRDFEATACNTIRSGVKGTTPVGSYPPAPSGCVDLCGNVWEFTCSPWSDDLESVVVKGGSWYDYPAHARLESRFRARVHRGGATIGFRCAYGGEMPPFLPADLIAAAIEFRRARGDVPAEPLDPSPEFEEVLRDLRATAEASVPGFARAARGPVAAAHVSNAIEILEPVETSAEEASEPHPIPPEPPSGWMRAVVLAQRIADVTHSFAERHPRLLVGGMGAAAAAVALILLLAPAEGRRVARVAAATESTAAAESGPSAVRAREGGRPRRSRWVTPAAAPSLSIQNGIQTLLAGRPDARDQAERLLLDHPADARAAIEEALRGDPGREAESSLRYLLAAIEESQDSREEELVVITSPPASGVLFFFDRLDGITHEEATKARLTAQAERVPFTFVYTGPHAADAVVRAFSRPLRRGRVYLDEDGELARRCRVAAIPAVAGLRAGGKVAFSSAGVTARSRIATEAVALRE